jgi:hypothetical protein
MAVGQKADRAGEHGKEETPAPPATGMMKNYRQLTPISAYRFKP